MSEVYQLFEISQLSCCLALRSHGHTQAVTCGSWKETAEGPLSYFPSLPGLRSFFHKEYICEAPER